MMTRAAFALLAAAACSTAGSGDGDGGGGGGGGGGGSGGGEVTPDAAARGCDFVLMLDNNI